MPSDHDGHTVNVGPVTVNNLDAIAALPFSALSGPEAGEVIRDSLIAEVRGLRAENAALAAALDDIAGMVPGTLSSGLEGWVATAVCARYDHLACDEASPDDTDEWCPVCVAEVAWCAWKMGVLG